MQIGALVRPMLDVDRTRLNERFVRAAGQQPDGQCTYRECGERQTPHRQGDRIQGTSYGRFDRQFISVQ
jgi:hypothetical protein